MAGLEIITGNDRLNILQCQELAKEVGSDTCEFDLCGPKGKLRCKWLDAYMGMFRINGQEGFVMTRQFQFASDLWCENITKPTAENL